MKYTKSIHALVLVCTMVLCTFSCTSQVTPKHKRPVSVELGKIFEKEGVKYLFGGDYDNMHFDISNCTLKDEQFHYGIGREIFPAILAPEFSDVETADELWKEDDRFLLVKIEQSVKAYSVKDLTRHEVVNDEMEGVKYMAAYCILADLGAVYNRVILEHEFTFALSGYTYYDPEIWEGMDGFVMWDRETESLWWPLIGKSVSGMMEGVGLPLLSERLWLQTTWKEIKAHYPHAMVMKSGLDFERPNSWPRYEHVEHKETQNQVAPKWGENNALEGGD